MPSLVIGLGNPGGEYAGTRHNMGWRCLDQLERMGRFSRGVKSCEAVVSRGEIEGFEVVLARPQTFMNNSGRSAIRLTRELGVAPAEVMVAHDDIDLPLGRLRLRRGGSAGGQNGVKSLIEAWRSQDFIRVRMGVGRPIENQSVIDYVLDRFHPTEREAADRLARRAAEAVVAVVREGLDPAMTRFNRVADDAG